MPIDADKQNDTGSTSGALERGGEGAGDHAAHHNALAAAVNALTDGDGSDLTQELFARTNPSPVQFGISNSVPTDDTTHNFDGGFFGVDVVTSGSPMAHVALQGVARIAAAGTGQFAWGINSLVETWQDHLGPGGAFAAEFDVGSYGTDSDTIWTAAAQVGGVFVSNNGSKRAQYAFATTLPYERDTPAVPGSPFVYGMRFGAATDGAGNFRASIWDGGADIVTEGASLTHTLWEAHVLHNAQPAFKLRLDGRMDFGDGTAATDTGISRVAPGVVLAQFALQLMEWSTPVAAGPNEVRLYAKDNGAGKTQLMAHFSSGAAQQLAIQP